MKSVAQENLHRVSLAPQMDSGLRQQTLLVRRLRLRISLPVLGGQRCRRLILEVQIGILGFFLHLPMQIELAVEVVLVAALLGEALTDDPAETLQGSVPWTFHAFLPLHRGIQTREGPDVPHRLDLLRLTLGTVRFLLGAGFLDRLIVEGRVFSDPLAPPWSEIDMGQKPCGNHRTNADDALTPRAHRMVLAVRIEGGLDVPLQHFGIRRQPAQHLIGFPGLRQGPLLMRGSDAVPLHLVVRVHQKSGLVGGQRSRRFLQIPVQPPYRFDIVYSTQDFFTHLTFFPHCSQCNSSESPDDSVGG